MTGLLVGTQTHDLQAHNTGLIDKISHNAIAGARNHTHRPLLQQSIIALEGGSLLVARPAERAFFRKNLVGSVNLHESRILMNKLIL